MGVRLTRLGMALLGLCCGCSSGAPLDGVEHDPGADAPGVGRDDAGVGDAAGDPAQQVDPVSEADPTPGCGEGLVPVDGRCVERREPTGLAPGWNEIKTGGDTLCVDGDEYAFYVRQGTVNRVLVFMQGGGACWDAVTCALPIYTRTVSPPGESGILDPDNPDNPFRDWHVVYIPYCSADVAFGDADRTYLGRTVHFRGFVNAEAVRHWIYEHITAPEAAFVSGCSAGAVGVIMHGTYLAEAYRDNPAIRAAMVTDSFQGIIPEDFSGMETWNAPANIPPWFPALREPPFSMARAIKTGAPRYPGAIIAHFNYTNDAVQASFYAAMGGNPGDTPRLMAESMRTLAAEVPNYRYYAAPGTGHCVFESDGVFTTEVAGVNLAQWLGDIANGRDVPSVGEID